MKTSLLPYFLALFIVSCNENTSNQSITISNDVIPEDSVESELDLIFEIHQDIDTFLLGDMNFDGMEDTAIVFSPFHAYPSPDDFSSGGCEDDSCLTTIKFSFTETNLFHSGALGFQTLFATEDLNADGTKEIGFIQNWFQSCWQGLFVYSLEKTEWKHVGSGSVYTCSEEDFSKRVVKIDRNNFKVISMRMSEDSGELTDSTVVFSW